MVLPLPPHLIHLWYACPNEIVDKKVLWEYEQLLNTVEKNQWQRFHFAKDRHTYLVTRALLRSVLSYYVNLNPKDWRFTFNAYGKPEIAEDLINMPLRFNLSHTDGIVICAIVLNHDIGVDVENIDKECTPLAIAQHCFAKQEIQALSTLPKNQQKLRFFHYWTLKESYIKAKGLGLSLPLDQFHFIIKENKLVQIRFNQGIQDRPEHWYFWQFSLSGHHIAALAVNSPESIKFELVIKKVTPLLK